MLTCQKHHFDLDAGQHYINGAYMSPISKQTATAGLANVTRKMKPYSIAPSDFFTDVERLKSLFAQMVNAEHSHRVALIPSVSYGTATVAQNLNVKSGQNIIVAEAQFPSNVYAWRRLAKEQNLTIKTVPYPTEIKEGRGKAWNDRILESIDNQTVLVSQAHVHWANGTKFDLKAIGKRCREVGAAFVIDGTQSVGALPFDVQEFGVDALICGGYKWLMGGYSLGYAYYGERFDGGKPLEDNWITRRDANNFQTLINYQDEFQPLSIRYDVGEKSNFILVPMGIAALSQLLDWGISNIQNYCRALTAEAVAEWRALGYWVEQDEWRGGHLFGVQMPPSVSLEKMQTALKAKNIHVSTRGDFVRISPNVYNEAADIAALSAVFKELIG
jgi:selenocysteine lyase/cysteine desulfurase